MAKDIKLSKVNNIVHDDYVSKIGNIVENIKDVTIEARLDKYKIFELKDIILIILHLEDKTGKICALLGGNRDDEDFKRIVNHIGINGHYRVRGSISSINEDMYEDLDDMFSDDINIKDYFIGNKLLSIRGIQNIDKCYGVDINTVYGFELNDAHEFVHKNTDSLKNISIDEDMLYKMANLHPIDTRLSSSLYSTFNGKEIFKTDIPIIQIEISIGLLPIKLNDIVEIDKTYKLNKDDEDKVNEAIQYINKYKKTFLEHWEGLITDKGLIDELFKGKKAKRVKKIVNKNVQSI